MNTAKISGSVKNTPKPRMKRKRKKKSKIYFGTPVQNAIIRYNECKNPVIQNRIYREHIQKAFGAKKKYAAPQKTLFLMCFFVFKYFFEILTRNFYWIL